MTTTHYIPDTTPPIPYTIIHSARRTLGLEVRDGKVTVRVPDRLPEREAERFVAKHTEWIIKKLNEDKERQKMKAACQIPAPQELTQNQIEQMKLEFDTKTKNNAAQMNVTYGRITILQPADPLGKAVAVRGIWILITGSFFCLRNCGIMLLCMNWRIGGRWIILSYSGQRWKRFCRIIKCAGRL